MHDNDDEARDDGARGERAERAKRAERGERSPRPDADSGHAPGDDRPSEDGGRDSGAERPGSGGADERRPTYPGALPPEQPRSDGRGPLRAVGAGGRGDGPPTAHRATAGGPDRGPGDDGAAELSGRQRLAKALWPPKASRAQLIVALLLFVLGLGLAIQVRTTSENGALRGARQEDLVRILDELDGRTKRLEDEKQSLERQRTELENSSDQAEEARRQTQQKARQLGVLAGTVAAQGPGITLTVTDRSGSVEADSLLDAVQELRAAGAEAMEVNGVRVVASTYFSDAGGGVRVDGRKISQPYRFQVIGKPEDLEPALNIPGGVVQSLRKEQAGVSVARSDKLVVGALRSAKRPDYARSSS